MRLNPASWFIVSSLIFLGVSFRSYSETTPATHPVMGQETPERIEESMEEEILTPTSDLPPQTKPPLLKLGDFEIHPHFETDFTYDDNIFIRPSNKIDDFIYTISPGIMFSLGDHRDRTESFLILDYTPSIIRFNDNGSQDSLDHDVLFDGQYRFSKLTLEAKQRYQALSGTVVDIGNRVDREVFSTDLLSRYELSEKTSFEFNFGQIITDYSNQAQFNSREWINQNWVNWQALPKTNVGLGATIGFLNIDSNPDQTYQQVLLRAIYEATAKLLLKAQAGLDIREFDTSVRDRVSPIFSLGAVYKPFDGTSLAIDGYRRIQNSASLFGQNFTTTGVALEARQRFIQKLFLDVRAGFENANYNSFVPGVNFNREDDYFFVRPSLEVEIGNYVNAAVFYLYRENDSTVSTSEFDNNQVGVEIKVAF